jgi:hypothetical protein
MLSLIAAIVAFTVIGSAYHQVKLSRRRDGLPKEQFVAEFEKDGVPTEVSGAVYDYYRKLCLEKSLRVTRLTRNSPRQGVMDELGSKYLQQITTTSVELLIW